MNRIQSLLSNPHTTWAGILAICLQIAQIWVPAEYEAKLDKTSVMLLGYASIMAADGKKAKDATTVTLPTDEPPTSTK